MCGLYGYFGKIKEGQHKKVMALIKALAEFTEIRGIDSTGYWARNKTTEYSEKQAVDATSFYEQDNMLQEVICEADCYVFLGHNRAASVGEVTAVNAHPFLGENIVQIHNGTARQIFDIASETALNKMEGETDSEAIMHHFDEVGADHYETWQKLDTYAAVIYEYKNDRLYFARDFWRPMYIYDLREELGVRIFVSTNNIMKQALSACDMEDKYKSFSMLSFNLYYSDIHDGELHRLNRYKTVKTIHYVEDDNETTVTQVARECLPYRDNKTKPKVIVRKAKPKPEPDVKSTVPEYQQEYFANEERKRQERINASMVVHGD